MSSEYNAMRDVERAPEIADMHLDPRPDGPAAAAMLAAGIGVFALGLLTTLSEASTALHDWLEAWDFDRASVRWRGRRRSPRSSGWSAGSCSRSPCGRGRSA